MKLKIKAQIKKASGSAETLEVGEVFVDGLGKVPLLARIVLESDGCSANFFLELEGKIQNEDQTYCPVYPDNPKFQPEVQSEDPDLSTAMSVLGIDELASEISNISTLDLKKWYEGWTGDKLVFN